MPRNAARANGLAFLFCLRKSVINIRKDSLGAALGLSKKTTVWEDDVGLRPTPRQGDNLRNLNRRHGHCRARASFRLTPTVRFALRASAHWAHARLRPPAPRYLGLRPKGILRLLMPFCFSSAFPFGATPQNPARAAWLRARNECVAKGRVAACVCAATLRLIEKPVKHRRPPLLFRSFASNKKMPRAKRLARGLGRSPKWVRKAKAE